MPRSDPTERNEATHDGRLSCVVVLDEASGNKVGRAGGEVRVRAGPVDAVYKFTLPQSNSAKVMLMLRDVTVLLLIPLVGRCGTQWYAGFLPSNE
jgi:hypothetical protein